MAKVRFTTIRNVPQWAACYFVNADASALTDEEIAQADAWYDRMVGQGLRPVSPIDGTENEFCGYPAFGLAGATVDFHAEILSKKQKKSTKGE